jgi:Protein of unknown function (DUF2591)
MLIETGKLIGTALDWAVASIEIEGKAQAIEFGNYTDDSISIRVVPTNPLLKGHKMVMAPSRLWEQGGKIIDREKISVYWNEDTLYGVPQLRWLAEVKDLGYSVEGDTALVAAMRCYVAVKRGEKLDVPEVLLMNNAGD